MQARLGGLGVLPWVGYNDVFVLERHGDRKFHPVCILCLLHPSGRMMSRDVYRRIALLPTIDASSFPGSGLNDDKDWSAHIACLPVSPSSSAVCCCIMHPELIFLCRVQHNF